ncbi:type VII secretion integral membrane protein EccD [Mycobacterium decipiens]|uniref:Type VII secretion integral membrane protein EccD n=1 Tax=Mycobacterium decipiens TaxID=1430326 RepID=A0A1X2M0A9_9MYCO|nr:type VII secretion integral membrane protein EccD [Mycobacterium decipiens]OSC42971.1 type VII secretion integral membrane protein EccD [Mycobacterium decipiens]
MSAPDPELRRVTVHAGPRAVDLALPAVVPVATLIPSIVDILDYRGASSAATRYQLSPPGAPALPSATTLAQDGIRDGAVLVLSQSGTQPPAPRCDDAAEAVAATLNTAARPHGPRMTRLTGALAASCITAGGAVLLVRNALSTNDTHYPGATVAIAAVAGFVALLFAVIAHRAVLDPIAGLTLSIIAVSFAAVAGLLAVPGAPGVHGVLLAAMAAAVTSVLAMRATGCGGTTLTAVACFAVVIAATALVGAITAAPLSAIGSLAALASLGLLEVSARMSIDLAGLSPRLPPLPNLGDTDALPAADRLSTRAIRADHWLTSLLAAFSSSAAIGAICAVLAADGTGTPGFNRITLAAVTGALLLLRARCADGTRLLVFAISGITTIATASAVAADRGAQHGPWIAALTAVLAAAAMFLGFVAPAISLSPIARRGVELLECLALIAMVPLTCWICGAFSAVRGLDLSWS